MRQEVNLLGAELVPRAEWLSIGQFLGLVLGTGLLLAAASGVQLVRTAQAGAMLTDTQRALASLHGNNEVTKHQRDHDPMVQALRNEIDALTQAQQSNGRLLALIGGQSTTNAGGFATYFEALARNHLEGVWLSKVAIDGNTGSIDLAGQATEPNAVPTWLNQLRDSSVFAKSVFSGLAVTAAAPAEPGKGEAVSNGVGFTVQGVR